MGKPIGKHKELRESINTVAQKLGSPEIIGCYRSYEILHANHYHDFMDKIISEQHKIDAEKLTNTLQKLITKELSKLNINP
jgi:hypothetical protein